LVWQGGSELAQYGMISSNEPVLNGWGEIIFQALQTAVIAVLQLAMIVIPLMIIMQFLRENGWMQMMSNGLAPFTRLLGMKENASITLVAGLTIGLAFGAGLMIQAVEEDGVSRRDMYLADRKSVV